MDNVYASVIEACYKLKRKVSGKKSPKLLMTTMKPKLDAIEKIRTDLNAENIEVPGIVVAGAQSAGKSSLLESLSDIKLPSGQNITTRVPLILRLERQDDIERYALISDNPDVETGEKIIDLDKIPLKITEYTRKIAGDGGCVEDKPIHLKVMGPSCPTMTLIDLPGITHMSLNNVQEDIHDATVNLVKKYISNEQMIILCVIPAVDDFANSEAIKLAKTVDPEGKRTLGVVTKVDLAKNDVKIMDKLRGTGNNVNLKLGFIAVKNKMNNENVSIKQARTNEKTYFLSSSQFFNVSREYWGTGTLIDRISELQMSRVEEFVPKMINTLEMKISETKHTLDLLAPQFNNDVQKMQHLVRIIVSVVSEFKSLAKSNDETTDEVELHVGPRIFEMYKKYCQALGANQPDFFSEDFAVKIEGALEESRSIMLLNFINHTAFNQLFIDSHLNNYKTNSYMLVEQVYQYCQKVLLEIVQHKIDTRYPQLNDATKTVITNFLTMQKQKALEAIETIVKTECFIFTQNKLYQNLIHADDKTPVSANTSDPTSIRFLQKSLLAYSDISIARLKDYVCMLCQHYLVTSVYKELHEFVEFEKMSVYLEDTENVVEKRKDAELSLKRFENSLKVLNKLKNE
jgi:GTP-binding protein EngB required for normal cell division